jgi:hypothetical protein
MIIYKAYLGQEETSNSVRALLASGELEPIDSWSEVNLTYEKYDNEDLKRDWDKIVKSSQGLQRLDRVPADGTWGLLYEITSASGS